VDFKCAEGASEYHDSYIDPFHTVLSSTVHFGRLPYIFKYLEYPKWTELKAAQSKLDKFHLGILENRRKEMKEGKIQREDFMDYLVSEMDPRTNANFTDMEIIMDISDLLIAGHETTSNSLCFALYYLAWNPNIQQALQEECDTFSTHPSYDDASKMKLCQAVIKESLRIRPVVEGLARQTDTPHEFAGFLFPAQSCFYFSTLNTGNDSRFFKDAEKFDPYRWIHDSEDLQNHSKENDAFLAFGTGARACIGNRMAMMEAKIIMCMLMQNFSVRRLTDVPMQVETAVTARPKGGLKLQFIPRTKQM